MRLLTVFLALGSLWAQDQAKPAEGSAKPSDQSPKPADQPVPLASAPAAPAPSGPLGEGWLQGSLEVGYRWIPNISGSFNTYRSVVNLGEGPKLMDAAFTLRDPSKRFLTAPMLTPHLGAAILTTRYASTSKRTPGTG